MTTVSRTRGRKSSGVYHRRQERERLILDTARDVFLELGWDGFGIESVADAMQSSRGTVYSHFPNKEEILLALAIESKAKRRRLLEMTLRFTGRARERLVAIDFMGGYLVRRDLPIEIFVTTARLRVNTTRERQNQLRSLELRLQSIGAGIVREAVGAGDLVLPRHTSPDDLYFALWSSVWGATAIQRSDFPASESGIAHPTQTVRRALLVMLDGFGWKPLSHEWDYRETCLRVEREIFASEEFRRLSGETEFPATE